MKVTRYFIEEKIDEPLCTKCGKKIKVGEVSYELRPDGGSMAKITKEESDLVWCKDCLPEDAVVYKGTQLHPCSSYRKNLKKGIR